MADEKKQDKKKTGRPRTVPKGAPQPSRDSEARRKRRHAREALPPREKQRKQVIRDATTSPERILEPCPEHDTPETGGAELDYDGLTLKERVAVERFLVHGNKKRAAFEAGYNRNGYPEVFKRPAVAEVVQREVSARLKKYDLTAENVLKTLSWMLFFDPLDLLNPDGSPKRICDMPEHVRYNIIGLEIERMYEGKGPGRRYIGQVLKYRHPSKTEVQALAMKHLKLLDGSGGTGKDRLAEVMAAFKAGPIERKVIEGEVTPNVGNKPSA